MWLAIMQIWNIAMKTGLPSIRKWQMNLELIMCMAMPQRISRILQRKWTQSSMTGRGFITTARNSLLIWVNARLSGYGGMMKQRNRFFQVLRRWAYCWQWEMTEAVAITAEVMERILIWLETGVALRDT